MKKIVCMFMVFVIVMSSVSFVSFAEDDIILKINGDTKNYVISPRIVGGEIFVPVMDVFRDLSCECMHVKELNTVTVTRNNITVKMTRDSKTAYINGVEYTLKNAPKGISQKFMVPAKFILDAIGDTGVYYEGTNTYSIDSDYIRKVAYQPTLAPLYSNIHRDIPTEFESGNSYDDIRYYTEEDILGNVTVPDGDDILVMSDLITHLKPVGNTSNFSSMEISDTTYGKTLKYTVTSVPETETDCIYNMDKEITGFEAGDTLIVSFKMRRISGGHNDKATIRIQMQERNSGNYEKNLYEYIDARDDWTEIKIPFEAKENYVWFSIRAGYYVQQFEIAEFKIENIGTSLSVSQVPSTIIMYPDFEKDAEWRKEALDRIDKNRKGDFKVVVKDRYGKVIPDAEVKFDMFESEYKFGTAISSVVNTDSQYKKNLGRYFNSAVIEHAMKWGPYSENPANARNQVNNARASGIKHFRGHSVVWEQKFASDGITYLVPEYCFNEDGTVVDEEKYKEYIESHMKNIFFDYAGEVFEWDVINELADNREFINVYGDSIVDFYIETARKYAPFQRFFYNEKTPGVSADLLKKYNHLIEYISKNKIDVDGIGFQSHCEYIRLRSMDDVNERFDRAAELGFDIGVTEYSYSTENGYLQANYTRDYFINAFSHPNNNEFLIWGFWDGRLYADYSPMFDKEWNLRLAGEQLVDLMYNKFWTRNECATTDSNGEAQINGFYGDYDVTVSVGDLEKTISCAYHKGYDNVLEIVIDDCPANNSENDMFSFVYSGKVQIEGKLVSDYYDDNPDYLKNAVSLIMTDKEGNIAHIAQTDINPDKTYSFEFKKDGLKYSDGKVEDYYITLNVNGMTVTDTVTTNMIIPECVTFDFDITQKEDKLSVVATLNNLIERKGIDYMVYTAFYNNNNGLLGLKKTYSSSTGEPKDITNISGLDIPDNTKYIKVLVWMNNGKMIPLTTAKQMEIN